MRNKMNWEWRLVLKVWNHHRNSVQWPTQMSLGLFRSAGPTSATDFNDFDEDQAVRLVEQLRVIRGETKVSPEKGLMALLKGAGLDGEDSEEKEEEDSDEDIRNSADVEDLASAINKDE